MLPAICIALVVVVAIAAIPQYVWSRFFDNVLDHRGQLRLKNVWRKVCQANSFMASFLLSLLVLTSLLTSVTILSEMGNRSVAETGILADTGNRSPVDRKETGSAPNKGDVLAVARLRETMHASPAGDSGSLLWSMLPVVAVFAFACVAIAVRLTSRGYSLSMDHLVIGLPTRNRQRIADRYLRSTAQHDASWLSEHDRGPSHSDRSDSQNNA
jgi:ABC-type multidrug transport system fused ATPase/permease subunit